MSVIDHWDWLRYALGLALIACNIGVWRGVKLEESDDRFDKEIGKLLLIRSLAWEAFFAAALFVGETASAVQQKSEIARLEIQNTKLEVQIQPRRLKPAEQKAIGETIAKFPFSKVRVTSYALDLDAAVLCGQIVASLSGQGVTPVPACASESAVGSFVFGVHIYGDNSAVVSALIKTFEPFNLGVTPQPPPPANGFVLGNPNEPADAKIFVGVKPIEFPAQLIGQ